MPRSKPSADRGWRRRARRSATHGGARGLRPGGGRHQAARPPAAAARAPGRLPGRHRYDLVILIDYPGFHVRVAEAAREAGTKVLYYIAPQLWAWRPGRARRFASAVDRLAVVLPFEQRFFGSLGLRSDYVGHPLVDRGTWPTRSEARARLGIPADSRVLGIFPGSRQQEIGRLWRPFRDAARRLLEEGRCDRVLVAGTPSGDYPDPGPLTILRGDPIPVFAAADAALAKSGTTTLEAALADVPMVVAYKVHPLTWLMFQRLRTVEWVSLVNLVAEREVVPEMLQEQAEAGPLAEALRPLLDPPGPGDRRPAGGTRPRPAAARRARRHHAGGGAGRRAARRLTLRISPSTARPSWPRRSACWPRPGGSGRSTRGAGARCTRPGGRTSSCSGMRRCCRCSGITGARSIAIVVSEARDGQYLADFATSLGYRTVRGSSRAEPPVRCSGAVRELQAGHAVAFTPDGPRGRGGR